MSVGERDDHTGHLTTGHEWNGIKELNTRVPRIVWVCLLGTFLYSVVYWLLMPAWPLGDHATRGILDYREQDVVAEQIDHANRMFGSWKQDLLKKDIQSPNLDPILLEKVLVAGKSLFGDNCSACHGIDGNGNLGFPSLADGSWLWSGEVVGIEETIRYGINSPHDDTQVSQMPAFGHDGLLSRNEVIELVGYLQSVSKGTSASSISAAGGLLFADNCAACHGDDAKGVGIGAPNLTDNFWIYGSSRQQLFETIWNGRQGHMPAWEGRLNDEQIRILAIFVSNLQNTAAKKMTNP